MKKCLLLLICVFAVIRTNAGTVSQDGLTYTIDGSEQISNLKASDIPSTVKTIKLTGTITGWNGGVLLEGIDGVTTIDLKDADFSATTVTITPTITQVQNEDGTTSNKITDYSYSVTNSWAFKNFDDLTNIIWPKNNSISVLPDYAFYGCSGLTSITVPNTVEVIGDHAFEICSSLATLDYQKTPSVKIFGENAFKGTALTSVTIPGSALLIRTNAFCEINALTTVTFAEECTENLIVKTHAFDNSSNITDVYILTTAHIQCEHDAFEDDFTFAHGQVTAPKATLHFPDSEADYFTNLTHYLSIETAADPGLFQAWLVEHYQLAGQAGEGKPGWWEFINTGGTDPEGDPDLGSKFLMTYSHPTHAHIVPNGVKAYIVNDIVYNSTHKLYEVQLKSISVIPARTGVILYGETNAQNSDGNGTLSMSLVTLAAPVTEGSNATLYPDGATTPSGVKVDLSLRRDNWSGLTRFNLGDFKNYLEPTANEEGTSSILNPFDTDENGRVAFRNFGFGHFYKTKIKNTSFDDYAGFFRCSKNSKISSGKAYLRLAANEFLSGDEMELLIKKDDGYYLRANPKSSPTATQSYTDERTEGYWSIATWIPAEDFGERDSSIPTSKFIGEPVFEEDETNGVAKIIIPVEAEEEVYYNLNGQRVTNPTHGIFIKNGKKVILK